MSERFFLESYIKDSIKEAKLYNKIIVYDESDIKTKESMKKYVNEAHLGFQSIEFENPVRVMDYGVYKNLTNYRKECHRFIMMSIEEQEEKSKNNLLGR